MKQYRIKKEGKSYKVQKRFWVIFWSEVYIKPHVIWYFATVEDARMLVKELKKKLKEPKVIEYL